MTSSDDVRDAPDRHRFEITVDGAVAGFATYRRTPTAVEFLHTEIDPAFAGQGLASTLVRAALDDVRREGLGVLPSCPFVRRYVSRHAEYLDLVPAEARGRFGLEATG